MQENKGLETFTFLIKPHFNYLKFKMNFLENHRKGECLKSFALLYNYVDSSVRDVFLYSGMGDNIRCRKDSPCSTWAKGSMYPRPARLRLRAALPPKGPAPRTFYSATSR